MYTSHRAKAVLVATVVLSIGAFATAASANHSWGGYHWARTANPFTLKIGDNVSSVWDAHLSAASADWSGSSVLDATVVSGQTNAKTCKAVNGRVEVCNSKYGNNGWLGIASIWVNGSHITKGTVKLNDTYFSTAKYNTSAWRRFVVCQEIGHTFGLNHQDEIFGNTNLGTCMDYTADPSTNQRPNAHDYEMLEAIYAHLDSFNTAVSSVSRAAASSRAADIDTSDSAEWGKAIRKSHDGRNSLYERNLGNGQKVFTAVIWAD